MNIVQTKNRIQMHEILGVDINFLKPGPYSINETTPGKIP